MIYEFLKHYFSTEACLKRHRQLRAAYKIEGRVVSGDSQFLCQGQTASYSKATMFLCIKHSICDIDYIKAWESPEYKYANDTQSVLEAECQRISELVNKRIEVISISNNGNEFYVKEIFNPNDRQYWLEETNL